MVKKVILVGVIAIAALIASVATRPSHFRIARATEIKAPAPIVFPLVNDIHKWRQWSPWEKIDPNMKRDYSGEYAGVGASYAWSGNDEVGKGRMTITESKPVSRVGIEIEFITPFAATNQVSFDLEPVAHGTKVTWAMEGENGFIAKAFDLLVDFDSVVGADYDKGLAKMKEIAEAKAAPHR